MFFCDRRSVLDNAEGAYCTPETPSWSGNPFVRGRRMISNYRNAISQLLNIVYSLDSQWQVLQRAIAVAKF